MLISDPFASVSFVYISPGGFLMGSTDEEFGSHNDEALHEVVLTKGFYMQATLVTQRQWRALMGTNPSTFNGGSADRPVDGVSWNDCRLFINKLNAIGGYKYRLATEAEWEYACRAGTSSPFPSGPPNPSEQEYDVSLCERGWYRSNSGGKTNRVAQKKPNPWGLYDMHGNLCEWCEDWYGKYGSSTQMDPVNTKMSASRVCRGGCWMSVAQNCRSACRFSWPPNCRSDFIGFRLVRDEE
ncbi:MAG: formylglycine-generating enzyme family protein [Desulforhabdus sp.]|nr:formylglycine-generating enzyme family protein [Desulforhabdus sp.]